MPTFPLRIFGSLALLLAPVACADDVDPLASAGTSISASGSASVSASASASGSASASASGSASASASGTTGGETGGETDATTGDPTTGGGGGGSKEVCERYIQCVSVTDPAGLPSAQEGFGDGSNCWMGSPQDAELCAQACQTGLTQAHAAFPTEEKCYACLSDADCDAGAGERCLLGGCTLNDCGDGQVNPDEQCDGQEECSLDCQTGAECSPLTNLGCSGSDICQINVNNDYLSECFYWEQFDNVILAGFGEGCGEDPNSNYFQCESGLACVSETAGNFNCDLDSCCIPYCDVNAPGGCPNGFSCVPFEQITGSPPSEPALAYLGICLP